MNPQPSSAHTTPNNAPNTTTTYPAFLAAPLTQRGSSSPNAIQAHVAKTSPTRITPPITPAPYTRAREECWNGR